jgi:hypothetical protein
LEEGRATSVAGRTPWPCPNGTQAISGDCSLPHRLFERNFSMPMQPLNTKCVSNPDFFKNADLRGW